MHLGCTNIKKKSEDVIVTHSSYVNRIFTYVEVNKIVMRILIVRNNLGCFSEGISRFRHKASVIELITNKINNAKSTIKKSMQLPPDEQ